MSVFADEFEPIIPRLRAKATAFTHCDADAEDLFSETLLRIWEKLSQYKPGSNAYGWALTVMRNLAADKARAASVRFAEELTPPEDMPDPVDIYTDATSRDALNGLDPVLIEALLALSDKLRVVLVLSDIQGLTDTQISERTGLSKDTVNSRRKRARERIRDALAA